MAGEADGKLPILQHKSYLIQFSLLYNVICNLDLHVSVLNYLAVVQMRHQSRFFSLFQIASLFDSEFPVLSITLALKLLQQFRIGLNLLQIST